MTAADAVVAYLRLVEERDLENAARHLADDVDIVFPGSRRFTSLHQQIAASRRRYRNIRKVFGRFDTLTDGESEIVYVIGTLEGVTLDGDQFDSIRFIDRFVLTNGLITSHHVWNDMAEMMVGSTQGSPDE